MNKSLIAAASFAFFSASAAFAASDGPPNRTIAYAFTDLKWAI